MGELSGITHAAEHANAQDILSDLARVKALFQARAIAAYLGVSRPTQLLPADQGASPRVGAGGEENLIHSGGNAA